MNTERIINQFEQVLNEHNYEWNHSAVKKIVETSLARKSHLIEIFRKHMGWDEDQLCIHFNQDMERRIDPDAYRKFLNYLWGKSLRNDSELKMEKIIYSRPNEKNDAGYVTRWGFDLNLYDVLSWLPSGTILRDFYDENERDYQYGLKEEDENYELTLEILNGLDEKFNFRPGMKLNRVVGKICTKLGYDKFPEYNRKFAEFSDAITPMKISRHTTISVNPVDFLLMSHGNSWTSCHYIGDDPDEAGCYSSGTVSYMMGDDSFIISIIDPSWGEEDLALAPKIMRQVCGYNDHQLLQSRLYPQNCDNGAETIYDNLRNIVEKIIANAEGLPNRWVKVEKNNIVSDGTAYQDWKYHNLCKMWMLRNEENACRGLEPVRMSYEPLCIKCGYEHTHEGNIVCEDCEGHYCEDCGCRIDLHDSNSYIYDEDEDVYYCTDCRFVCDKCGDIERRRNDVWITDIDEHWCSYCARRHGYQCAHCGDWISEPYACDSEGNPICESCYDWNYTRCDKCEELFLTDEMVEIDGQSYCPHCAELIQTENEEEVSA